MQMSTRAGLFTSLRHRDYALLMGGLTASMTGDWAYNVALTVWIFDQTRSASWLAAATVGRFIPALLFGPYGGVIAERFERVRLMVVLDLVSLVLMSGLAAEMALGHSATLAIALGSVNGLHTSVTEPAVAAMTPQLVGERDLGSANTLRNTIDNVCVIAGPGVGAALLLLGEPWVAVAVNASTFLVSALLISRIRSRSVPVDVTEGGTVGPLGQMLVGVRTILSSGSAAVLVGFCLLVTLVYGIDCVQFVLISREVLGTGAEGYGYLLAGLGVGGVAVGALVVRLERLPRLSAIIVTGVVAYCVPTLLFLVVHQPLAGFAIQVVRGAGTLVVDVLAITALQRSLPNDVLGRVFGAFNTLVMLAILIGGAVTAPIVRWVGLDGSLWFAGLLIPLVGVAGLPALRRMDRTAAARRAELAPIRALIEACHLFETVSDGGLDQLAGSVERVEVVDGEPIVVEGDPADAFYIIENGTFAVSSRSLTSGALDDLGSGDYFGEIGLIEGIPRTATVTARGPGRLLRVSGEAFIGALTESAPSAALLNGAAFRLGRTHPTMSITAAGLEAEATGP
jgi:MFS family permease